MTWRAALVRMCQAGVLADLSPGVLAEAASPGVLADAVSPGVSAEATVGARRSSYRGPLPSGSPVAGR